MYTRSQVAALAGIDTTKLATLTTRDQLPFLSAFEEGDPRGRVHDQHDSPTRRWNRYSADEVLQVAVAERFGSQIGLTGGLPFPEASRIVSNCIGDVTLSRLADSQEDLWIGYAGRPIEPGGTLGGEHYAAPLLDVAALIQARTEVFGAVAVRVFLVNASQVAREIAVRARRAGIEWPKAA